jgi:hypothetical protein
VGLASGCLNAAGCHHSRHNNLTCVRSGMQWVQSSTSRVSSSSAA